MNPTSTWSLLVPAEEGDYVFAGWTSELEWRNYPQPSLYYVRARMGANKLFFDSRGAFVYPSEMRGKWLRLDIAMPLISREDFV